jgi:hypothetical protein
MDLESLAENLTDGAKQNFAEFGCISTVTLFIMNGSSAPLPQQLMDILSKDSERFYAAEHPYDNIGFNAMRKKAEEWNDIIDSGKEKIVFINDFQCHRKVNEFEEYDSVMPWGSNYGGRESYPEFWDRAIKAMGKGKFSFLSGTVLPGFDNRGSGGWGTDIFVADRKNGAKFRDNWEEILKYRPLVIHIPTWNDFNEGGTIEPVKNGILHSDFPSEGYGYRELETVQDYAEKLGKIKPDREALRIPQLIYLCRKLVSSNRDLAKEKILK